MRTFVALFVAAALAVPAPAQHLTADGAPQTFHFLTEQYFDEYFGFHPTAGTSAGFHRYDTELEVYSAASTTAEIAWLHSIDKKLALIDLRALDASDAADFQILVDNIHSQLLSLEVIRSQEKNPDRYSSGITNSVFVIMEREYASANTRLRAVVAREQKMPQVLGEAQKNLKDPPRIFTEIALQQLDGDISFFEKDLPKAFASATDDQAKADFAKSNSAVLQALKLYGAWLKSDLLPRSNGDFRLGADTFRKKLLFDEMVDLPLDHLLDVAYADLHKNQADFASVAKQIDPIKMPQQVLAELGAIHPAPDLLLSTFQQTFDSLTTFIRVHHIVTLPSNVTPVLEETPPFLRATTFASMDPPGPYETESTKAYFNVTLPEKDWAASRVAEYMSAFNVGTIVSTSVHEAYPGHYVQYLYTPTYQSKVRRIINANTNVEGWAHYCEQMMLDAGFAAAPPNATPEQARQARLIRLGQIQDALLRDARFVVSIKLHTGDMTFDQAVDFFVKEGYQSHETGLVETRRGTSDATYLYYTLGKLQILKLRDDLKKKQGAAFSLQQFHDAFLKQGPAPIKIIRKAMLHDDSPTL